MVGVICQGTQTGGSAGLWAGWKSSRLIVRHYPYFAGLMTQRRTWLILLILIGACWTAGIQGAELREDCDSCRFEIDQLQEPRPLRGRWLFTREDDVRNKLPETDTRRWVTVSAPGSWEHAYGDGESFLVGWYRANFQFNQELVGQKAVFYFDAHLNRVQVFLDGALLWEREGEKTYEDFRSLQAVPVVIPITKPQHVLTLRIESPFMAGFYQLPLQLRPFRDSDPFVNVYRFIRDELRIIAAYVMLWSGLFCLLLYARTRFSLYLVAGLTALGIFPFFGLPTDMFIRMVSPQTLSILHFIGILGAAVGHVIYSQYYHKFTPRLNRLYFGMLISLSIVFLGLCVSFHQSLFMLMRRLVFILAACTVVHAGYNYWRGMGRDRQLGLLLFGEIVFGLLSLHDFLIAMSWIQSINLVFLGALVAMTTIMYNTAHLFAKTFIENRQLLAQVEEINSSLEATIDRRTRALQDTSRNLRSVLQSLPQGVLTVDGELRITTEYSRSLSSIFAGAMIQGQDLMEFLFQSSKITPEDQENQRRILLGCIGKPVSQLEASVGQLITGYERLQGDKVQHLTLGWSPIVNDGNQVERIIVTVQDITQIKGLEAESNHFKLRSKMVEAFLDGSSGRIQDFIQKALDRIQPHLFIMEAGTFSRHHISELFQVTYAIKGQARLFDLQDVAERAHSLENTLADLAKVYQAEDYGALHGSVRDLVDSLRRIEGVIGHLGQSLATRSEPDVEVSVNPRLWKRVQSQWTSEVTSTQDGHDTLSILAFKAADECFAGLRHRFDEWAERLGKERPLVVIEASDRLFLDPRLVHSLQEILRQLIRNSLDHGIEYAEDRQLEGKPKNGTIHIRLRIIERGFALDYVDDGRGLDLERIRAKALVLKMMEVEEKDPGVLTRLIFKPGFSTILQGSIESGRGIGLDVVAGEMEKWGATLVWNRLHDLPPGSNYLPFDVTFTFDSSAIYILDEPERRGA